MARVGKDGVTDQRDGGRIKTILHRHTAYGGVTQGLGYHQGEHRQACNDVVRQPRFIVVGKPVKNGHVTGKAAGFFFLWLHHCCHVSASFVFTDLLGRFNPIISDSQN
jgi:hypothetical protein